MPTPDEVFGAKVSKLRSKRTTPALVEKQIANTTKRPPAKLPYEGWTPMKGLSQSLLQNFINDTDRFHKKAVLGLKEVNRREAMEYGTMFHKLIELGARMGRMYTRSKLLQEANVYFKRFYPSDESTLLAKIAVAQYHVYREWEHDKPNYKYIDQEPVFKEPFKLPPIKFKPNDTIDITIPSGIIIPLRGRIDEVIERSNGMWIQENKTKGRIDVSFIQDTIHKNIQVMFYAVCSELKYGRPCRGVIYNVIRKPGQRQRQKESDEHFIDRIVDEMKAQPDYYFYRFEYEFKPGAVEAWVREELLPLLYRVYIWWKSIESNPTNPWVDANGNPNPFHGRKPFGVYDSMSLGKGDYYNLIVYGIKQGLIVDHEMFPELQEELDD